MSGQEDYVLVPRELLEWADDLYAAFCRDASSAQQREAIQEYAKASNAFRSTSPQPQGVDTHKCFECGEELVTLCLACNPLAQAAHPQPSGDGLSDETLREMLAQQMAQHIPSGGAHYVVRDPSKDNLIPIQTYTAQVLAFARAVEARVRSTPTDEWRRAVEDDAARWRALMACPRIRLYGCAGLDPNTGEKNDSPGVHFGADFWSYGPVDDAQSGKEVTAMGRNCLIALADEIRALSPAKPDDGAPMPTGRTETR